MNTFAARLRRFSRLTVSSLSLLVLALSVAMAEGWGNLGKPPTAAVVVNGSHILYADGSELTVGGTYTTGGFSYSVPAAIYDGYDNLWYSENTVLYTNGTWHTFPGYQ